jgi:hypothetical protein
LVGGKYPYWGMVASAPILAEKDFTRALLRKNTVFAGENNRIEKNAAGGLRSPDLQISQSLNEWIRSNEPYESGALTG